MRVILSIETSPWIVYILGKTSRHMQKMWNISNGRMSGFLLY